MILDPLSPALRDRRGGPVLDYLVCGTAILDPRPVAPSCAKEKSSGVGNAVEPGKNNKSLTQRMRISLIFI